MRVDGTCRNVNVLLADIFGRRIDRLELADSIESAYCLIVLRGGDFQLEHRGLDLIAAPRKRRVRDVTAELRRELAEFFYCWIEAFNFDRGLTGSDDHRGRDFLRRAGSYGLRVR